MSRNLKSQRNLKTKIEIVALGTPDLPQPYSAQRTRSKLFIPLGKDNLFPDQVAELQRESATLKPVIASKAEWVAGDEIQTESEAFATWLESVNPDQSIQDLLEIVAGDYFLQGNAFVQVARQGDQYGLFRTDPVKVRLKRPDEFGADPESVLLSPNWSRYSKEKDLTEIPLFPAFDSGGRSMIHIKRIEAGFDYYGMASWVGAMHYAKAEYLIGMFQTNTFDNSLFSSGVLTIPSGGRNEDQKTELVADVKSKLMGTENRNAQKVIIIVSDDPENQANFEQISNTYEGSWLELKNTVVNTIITANQWFPSLAGLAQAGQLGTNQQIRNEYEIAKKLIGKVQTKLLRALLPVFQLSGFDEIPVIINEAPISKENDVPIAAELTRSEKRLLWGYEAEPEDTLVLSESQTKNVIDVTAQFKAGTLTRDQAINILIYAVGMPEQEATQIIGNDNDTNTAGNHRKGVHAEANGQSPY